MESPVLSRADIPLTVLVTPSVPESCLGCGVCCMCAPPLQPLKQDHANIPEALLAMLLRYRDGPLAHNDRGSCLFLDRYTGSCDYYEDRPPGCRGEVERGGETCLSALAGNRHG